MYCALLTIDFDFVMCDLLGSPQIGQERNHDNLIKYKLSSNDNYHMVVLFQ